MVTKIFIDGQAGTTGLRIRQRLETRRDLELITLPEEIRKDTDARRKAIASSDITFLCLPDVAAKEAVALAGDCDVRIIDASTAHRTHPDWAYGFPELSRAHREKIGTSAHVAVPGCYASGFASLVYPMAQSGWLPKDYPVQCFAISGYSGGGKAMIAEIESPQRVPELYSPRVYGLGNHHKHLPEMQQISGLTKKPMFTPIVDDFYNGMLVCVPIQADIAGKPMPPKQIQEMFTAHYAGASFVHVMPLGTIKEMDKMKLSCNDLRDTNDMEIFVFGNDSQILLCSRLDNLGKGASGAAVQCMNLMLGLDETTGLR